MAGISSERYIADTVKASGLTELLNARARERKRILFLSVVGQRDALRSVYTRVIPIIVARVIRAREASVAPSISLALGL